jgi:hypothetical protein
LPCCAPPSSNGWPAAMPEAGGDHERARDARFLERGKRQGLRPGGRRAARRDRLGFPGIVATDMTMPSASFARLRTTPMMKAPSRRGAAPPGGRPRPTWSRSCAGAGAPPSIDSSRTSQGSTVSVCAIGAFPACVRPGGRHDALRALGDPAEDLDVRLLLARELALLAGLLEPLPPLRKKWMSCSPWTSPALDAVGAVRARRARRGSLQRFARRCSACAGSTALTSGGRPRLAKSSPALQRAQPPADAARHALTSTTALRRPEASRSAAPRRAAARGPPRSAGPPSRLRRRAIEHLDLAKPEPHDRFGERDLRRASSRRARAHRGGSALA